MARIPLSRSQQNLYNGVRQDSDPALYLIGKSYRFHPLELSGFRAALAATVNTSPVQLCVLEAPPTGDGYPDLVPRLQFADIVRIRSDDERHLDRGDADLTASWAVDILAQPLVRYTVRTNAAGQVSGLDVFTHHILLDGSATGIIEADLAHYLASGDETQIPGITDGLTKLTAAHRRETSKVMDALPRLAAAVQRELADEARHREHSHGLHDNPGTAAKGVLQESVTISGQAYAATLALSEREQIGLNVLLAAAALAVDASRRQSTQGLLVHAVDNRFADSELNVATCLVNSVAHTVRFLPFSSVRDVVRMLDRGYVRAVRRRWLREEHYRRMYLAINQTSQVDALTLNFIREPCAPSLRPFLSDMPVATDIGPVEGMTVAAVLDEEQRALHLTIWNRADLAGSNASPGIAERIAAALESMAAMWDQPIARTVNEWFAINPDGACRPPGQPIPSPQPGAPAWFLDAAVGISQLLDQRRYVVPWLAWLIRDGVAPGDVLVFTDDNTDRTIDFLIACHLAGCGYSACDTVEEVEVRATTIAEHSQGLAAHVVDLTAIPLPAVLDDELRGRVNERIESVRQDPLLATKTAYLMPTSGSTGTPKLVEVSHGSLALFCDAVRCAYGWGTQDTILQCAPLTSDISVEEIFAGTAAGARLVRSTATRTGDLTGLAHDASAAGATVLDLPTAVWHLLCEDHAALDTIRRSPLRQIIIGGEAIRPSAVDKWINSSAAQDISLTSTYGPTEATVIASYLPIAQASRAIAGGARLRLGRPLVPDTMFIAFGEVVIVGELVSAGYLGIDGRGFGHVTGTVTSPDGAPWRAFATADRVRIDADGFPVFAGRKDAIVKIAGKRVDTAEVATRIAADPAVCDVAVELRDSGSGAGLGVWFQTQLTRDAADDPATAARIRRLLLSLGVSSFFVVGVPRIPRKPNGKIDSDNLPTIPQRADAAPDAAEAEHRAAGLATVWSQQLGSAIGPDTSLLEAGIGSLDLIRILPATRSYLGRDLSLLELISADTAANLVRNVGGADGQAADRAEIETDLAALCRQQRASHRASLPAINRSGSAIVVLGASGILGTGFGRAVLDLRQSGAPCPDVIFASRSTLPNRDPWSALRSIDGVRIHALPAEFGEAELDALLDETGATTVINCIGNTNVLVPYRELRSANVELVCAIAQVCARRGVRLVHLSTFVVNADVAAPSVTDPRDSPYPYAASKSLAELAVARSPSALDFTLVRLPRVLGEDYQLRDSADVLVSVIDAGIALRAYPTVTLTEEVTTGRAAAHAILGLLPEITGSAELGRGLTVLRGEAVNYAKFLSGFGLHPLDVTEWKHRLDQREWAKRTPRRWSVVDAWVSLGRQLGPLSYGEYLAQYPTLALGVEPVAEIGLPAPSVQLLRDFGAEITTASRWPA